MFWGERFGLTSQTRLTGNRKEAVELLSSQLVKIFEKSVPSLKLRTAEEERCTEESILIARVQGDEIVAIKAFAVVGKKEVIPRRNADILLQPLLGLCILRCTQ